MSAGKDLNLTVAETGPRRLILHDVQIALAPRRWMDLDASEIDLRLEPGLFPRVIVRLKPKTNLTLEGLRINLSYQGQTAAKSVQSHFGFNSFAYNGVKPEQTRAPRWSGGVPPVSPLTRLLFSEKRGLAWWVTALKSTQGPEALFAAAASARFFPTAFSIHKSGDVHMVSVFQGLQGERLHLAAGNEFEFDAVCFQISTAILKTFEDYGQTIAKELTIPQTHAGNLGWSSWYKYYPRIDANIIDAESAAVKKLLSKSGFALLQVDDGYQIKIGDWEPNPQRFPQGMEPAAKEIRGRGQIAGLWFAPFMVDKKSRLAAEHPEWLLENHAGKKLFYKIPRHSTNYILDVSNPEVQKWLFQTVAKFRGWGFRYLKADFLLLAAAAARRHDSAFTGLQAYRKGLQIIREAAGPETRILFSGSIDLPGAGLGDANRLGPDIAYDVGRGGTRRSFIRAEMAATASHFFMGHRWFTPNTDALMIRPPLKLPLVEVLLAQAAMTGGDYILSDDLGSLNKRRLEILTDPTLISMVSTPAHFVPLDYFEHTAFGKFPPQPFSLSCMSAVPRIWLRQEPGGRRHLFIFNLSGKTFRLDRDLAALCREGLGKATIEDGEFKDLFHGETLIIRQGQAQTEVPADSVRIFPL